MHAAASFLRRAFALALAGLGVTTGCHPAFTLGPQPGLLESQRGALIAVPHGFVNAAGGNLHLARTELSVDTIVGRQQISARYNAADGVWRWNFELTYDGSLFVDETGAELDLGALADGEPVPGTRWRRRDATRVETRGGLAYHFAAGRVDHVRWASIDYPRIRYDWLGTSLEISQCLAPGFCTPIFEVALDASGRPQRVTDPRTGRVAELAWQAGRLIGARSPADVEEGRPGFAYEYQGSLLTAITNSEEERVEYQ